MVILTGMQHLLTFLHENVEQTSALAAVNANSFSAGPQYS